MALIATNTTCDIYRFSNAPPNAPNVAAVPCQLTPKGASELTARYYTHVLRVPPTTDLRDQFVASTLSAGAQADTVYVPDRNGGLSYRVVLVRRVGRGTPLDHKEALVLRNSVTWPTDNI